MDIAARHDLVVIEDAAQGLLADYRDRPLGGIGHMAALSFHETKNIISGEGGALLVNDPRFVERAEIVWEKGTNRSQFFRGQVDKYTWVDLGSSYLPGEIIAAFLWAQMEERDSITTRRMAIWDAYHEALAELERRGPRAPADRPAGSLAQRPHVLPAAARPRATDGVHRAAQGQRDPVGVPLHPAALVAVRAIGGAVRTATCRGRTTPAIGWCGCRCGSGSRIELPRVIDRGHRGGAAG